MKCCLCYQPALLAATDLAASGTASAAENLPAWLTLLMWLAGTVVVLSGLALIYAIARRRLVGMEIPVVADAARLRFTYLMWLLAYFALAVYGSLVPLKIRPVAWDAAIEQFRNIRYLQLSEASRADWVANILLFIPLAYFATAVLTLGVRSWLVRSAGAVVVAGSCMALSVVVEFVQIWFYPRTVSLNDILAESIGGGVGAVLWLVLGMTVHRWLAAYFAPQRRRTQIDLLLEFYLVGLVVYSLLPLDLTISPAELYRKFRDGKVQFIPFAEYSWDLALLYAVATNIAIFIPVGMFCSTALTSEDRPVRSVLHSTLLGAGVAAIIEVAQLFVIEHFTSMTTVILAAVGCSLGAVLMHRIRGRDPDFAHLLESLDSRRRAAGVCLALMGIYSLILLAVFCSGGVWETDPERIWRRFHGFWRPPMSALYWGREYNALSDVLRKILFFIPLGGLGAVAVWGKAAKSGSRHRLLLAAVLLYAASISFSIEMLQVYLPPPQGDPSGPAHVADVGDVLTCTAGAAIGLFLTWRALVAPAESEPTTVSS